MSVLLGLMFLLGLPAAAPAEPAPPWRALAAGLEYARVEPGFQLLRIDPTRASLELHTVSERGGEPRTAASWCKERRLVAAINAGMFATDRRTNVGYLRNGGHLNNPRLNGAYRSLFVFGPGTADLIDLEDGASRRPVAPGSFGAVQNLRLIKHDQQSVWRNEPRAWSEAAVAIDSAHRVLFIFSRAPHPMAEFNRLLLAVPGLDVRSAMHVEGGPEASLSIHAGGVDLDLAGSYETGFNENDQNQRQWTIPNVLGVSAAPAR
jgi:hypothetical protein